MLAPSFKGAHSHSLYEMSKGPPPAYVPESDTRPLLVTEQYPQPHGPSPFGIIHVSANTITHADFVNVYTLGKLSLILSSVQS